MTNKEVVYEQLKKNGVTEGIDEFEIVDARKNPFFSSDQVEITVQFDDGSYTRCYIKKDKLK